MAKAMTISGMKENTPWLLLGAVVLGGGGYLAYRFLRKDEGDYVEPGWQGPPTPDQQWPPQYADEWQDNYQPPTDQQQHTPPIQSGPPRPGGPAPGGQSAVTPIDTGSGTTSTVGPGTQSGSSITTTGSGITPTGSAKRKDSTPAAAPAKDLSRPKPKINLTPTARFVAAFQALAKVRPAIAAVLAQVNKAMQAAVRAQKAVNVDDTGGATAGVQQADVAMAQAHRLAAKVKIPQEREATKLLLKYFQSMWLAWKARLNNNEAAAQKYENQARRYAGQIQKMIAAAMEAIEDAKKARRKRQQEEEQANSGGLRRRETPALTSSTTDTRVKPRSATVPAPSNSGGAVTQDTSNATMTTSSVEARKNDVQSRKSSSTVQRSAPTVTARTSPTTQSTADMVRAQRNGTMRTSAPQTQQAKSAQRSSARVVPAKVSTPNPVERRQPMTAAGVQAAPRVSQTEFGAPRPKMVAPKPEPKPKPEPVAQKQPPRQKSHKVSARTTPANANRQREKARKTAQAAEVQASTSNRSLQAMRPKIRRLF